MKIICIIGSSGTIAKKLQSQLLKDKNIKIYGCSRSLFKLKKKNFFHSIVDASNAKQIREWYDMIYKKEKKIDSLVCLSGTTKGGGSVYNMDENYEYESNFDNFFKSLVISNKEILKYFIKRKSGSIINFSSISCKKNLKGSSMYSASKSASAVFTKILARENIHFKINANIIIPNLYESLDTKQRGNVWRETILSLQDISEVKVQSLANLIKFLSEKNNYCITGQEISIGSVL